MLDCLKAAEQEYTWPVQCKGSGRAPDVSMYAATKAFHVPDIGLLVEPNQCFAGDENEHV